MASNAVFNAILRVLIVFLIHNVSAQLSTEIHGGLSEPLNGSHTANGSDGTGNSQVAEGVVDHPVEPETSSSAALRRGLVIFELAGAVYSFAAIGIICGDYFLPSVDCICSDLNLSQDVAAATFMSFATTSPELFVILISTFLTKSDIGLGAVVGSGMFNILGVATVGGLAAITSIKLDWWPLFRDSLVYVIAVSILAVVLSDGLVTLSESICLIFYYFIYFLIMYWNQKIRKKTKAAVKFIRQKLTHGKETQQTCVPTTLSVPTISQTLENGTSRDSKTMSTDALATRGHEEGKYRRPIEEKEDADADNMFKAFFVHYEDSISLRRISASSRGSAFSERRKSVKSTSERKLSDVHRKFHHHHQTQDDVHENEIPVAIFPETIVEKNSNDPDEEKEEQTFRSIFCTFPTDTLWNKFTWLALWPISFLFFWTIPDCRSKRWKRFYAITFIMCIVWIGISCYGGARLISAIGETFEIPDAVMGLTLLAVGGSMPEAISTFIMARQGEGGLGFSNSLGGNTMDICLCLGLPWLIMALKEGSVKIVSSGLQYNTLSLVVGIIILISVCVYTKFHMNRTMGVICCVCYLIFTVVSVLIELNIIQLYDDG